MFLTFLSIITRWSRSTSNFYALIGQNLTGEFMRKFMQHLDTCSLIAEADRVLCHLVMFLTVFFYWIILHNEIQLLSRFFCISWLVCLLRFCLRNAPPVKVIGNPSLDGIVFKNELTHLPLFEA